MRATDIAMITPRDKSTNVRHSMPDARAASFHVLGLVAPALAGRWAAKLFLTPPRPRPLSARMTSLLERSSDRFTVELTTAFGGVKEDCRLQVAVWGKGPAVYLLHGWGGRGGQWVSFIDPLVAAGFTAVVLDAPMHGESLAQRTSILHFAAALSAVVESVGPARLVVGHSLGAAACSLALQDEPVGNNPRRGLDTGGVVFIGSPADPTEFFGSFLRRLGVSKRLHQAIRSDVEHRYGFRWSDLAVRPPERATEIPALVVHDRDDLEVAYEDAERIVRAWPASTLLATSHLGHQRILRSDLVVERVVDFARVIESKA
jgi:pimeloyl-ACP methyl ester carboxylesterase